MLIKEMWILTAFNWRCKWIVMYQVSIVMYLQSLVRAVVATPGLDGIFLARQPQASAVYTEKATSICRTLWARPS